MHRLAACDPWGCIVLHQVQQRAWLVRPLDAHDATHMHTHTHTHTHMHTHTHTHMHTHMNTHMDMDMGMDNTWLVRPLDAHDAVEQLALEGVGELGVRRAAEELRIELERVVLRARLLVRLRVRDRRKVRVGGQGQWSGPVVRVSSQWEGEVAVGK